MDIWLPSDTSVSAANAIHYIFSIETKPTESFDLNFDFYYKVMHHTAEINQVSFMELGVEKVSELLFMGNAKAYGAEVFLQKSFGRLTG